jgi:DNA-binding response OmpR family regulator
MHYSITAPGDSPPPLQINMPVARPRKKLEADPQNPRYLRIEPGVGYRLLSSED